MTSKVRNNNFWDSVKIGNDKVFQLSELLLKENEI